MALAQPTAIHKLKGSYERNPERENKKEPMPKGEAGDPPDELTDAEKAAWYEVLKYAPPGVIFDSDRLALEGLAKLIVEMRELGTKFNPAKIGRFQGFLAHFGMTPSSRSKIVAVKRPGEDDPWSKL
jgi:hypothetical protein